MRLNVRVTWRRRRVGGMNESATVCRSLEQSEQSADGRTCLVVSRLRCESGFTMGLPDVYVNGRFSRRLLYRHTVTQTHILDRLPYLDHQFLDGFLRSDLGLTAENARPENERPSRSRGVKMQDIKMQHRRCQCYIQLECGPMPNLMVALPNTGGALCSTPQSLADAHY